MIQALAFYIPHIIWKMVSRICGYNVNQLVKYAAEAVTIDTAKKTKVLSRLSKEIEKNLRSQRSKSTNASVAGQCNNYLVATYFSCKILYIMNLLGQFLLMKSFLGFNSVVFGFHIVADLARGRSWQHSGRFPRVTWCDVPVRQVGQANMRSVQCVLPVNMLNEKLYLFLWFWSVVCLVALFVSSIQWIVKMCVHESRQSFLQKYLSIFNPNTAHDTHEFYNKFLHLDGLFIMQMMAENVGDIVTAEILIDLWKKWQVECSNIVQSKSTISRI